MTSRRITFGTSFPRPKKNRWSHDSVMKKLRLWCQEKRRDITSTSVAKEFGTTPRHAARCLSVLETEGLVIRAGWGKKSRGGRLPIVWDVK